MSLDGMSGYTRVAQAVGANKAEAGMRGKSESRSNNEKNHNAAAAEAEVQVLVKVEGRTRVLVLPSAALVAAVLQSTSTQTGLPSERLKAIHAGRLVRGDVPLKQLMQQSLRNQQHDAAGAWLVLEVVVSGGLKGGKGGFGAMLRTMGKTAGKTATNFGACRDLSGRRLRHVNDEIILKKWQQAQAEGKEFDPEERTKTGIDLWYLDLPSWSEYKGSKRKAYMRPRRKTQMCKNWLEARERRTPPPGAPPHWGCPRGPRCEFAHGEAELRGKGLDAYKEQQKTERQQREQAQRDAYVKLSAVREDAMTQAVLQGLKSAKRARREQEAQRSAELGQVMPVTADGRVHQQTGGCAWITTLAGSVNSSPRGEVQGDGDFSSVCVAGCAVTSGKWYYEVTLLTDGIAQIGWADNLFKGNSDNGDGVGDDVHSWAFDGVRCRKWNQKEEEYGRRWKSGDVVGCSLDLDTMEMRFTLNGEDMGVAFDASVLQPAVDAVARSQQMSGAVAVEAGFFPALALERQEALEINIGQRGFRHQPEGFRAVMASMPSELVAAAQSHAEGEAYVQIESDAEDEVPEGAAVEAAAAVVEEVVSEVTREAAQTQQTQQTQRNAEESKSAAADAGDDDNEPLTDIDLNRYTSAEQLESCGLKRLKYALELRGVKAGGTLQERAARLFSLKGLKPSQYDPKILSKKRKA